MNKIKDRMILGTLAGLGANIVKNILGASAMKLELAEIDGPHRAAGMLVPPHKIADPKGKLVGVLADSIMAGTLGVASLSILKLFGKKHAVIKGGLVGAGMWTMLYGVLGTLGATKVNPVSPSTVLTEFVEHTVFGAVTAGLITKMADPSIFNKTSENSDQTTKQTMPNTSHKFGRLKLLEILYLYS